MARILAVDDSASMRQMVTFTLKGAGVKHLRNESRGNMIVVARVETPERLTPRQQELLTEFAALEKENKEYNEEGFLRKIFRKTG